jgi:hypothetical protein
MRTNPERPTVTPDPVHELASVRPPTAYNGGMAGGRKAQPLFDLIRGREAVKTSHDRRTSMNPGVGWRPGMNRTPGPSPVSPGRPAGDKPVIRLNVTPQSIGAASPSRDLPPDGSAGADAWAASAGARRSTVRVPVNAIYLAIAGLVLVVVLSFAVGSVLSKRQAQQAALRQLPQPIILEPSEVGEGGLLADDVPHAPPTRVADPAPARTQSAPRPGDAPCLLPSGWTSGDPRTPGLNYLLLATLTQTESEDAVSFLATHGLETFAIRVENQGPKGNNSGPARSYRLYVLKGITSEEYSRRMTARTNIEADVARLGPRWQKERRGSSNFAKPVWEKK